MRLKFAVRRIIEKLTARKTKMAFRLLDLPDELVVWIVESIDDVATLARLACTSHRLQGLTEPVLWRQLQFNDASKARQILIAMNSRDERALALQSLNVPCNERFGRDMAVLAAVMEKAKNVKEMTVQSPLCNKVEFEAQQEWSVMMDHLCLPFQRAAAGPPAERPLQKLSKLTLHWNGPSSPYWSPDHRSLSILLSSTLQYLKVSCVNIPEDLFHEVGERYLTPLRELVLEECNISPRGLHGLLGLPKALEILHLGENVFNQRHFDDKIAQSFNHLFQLSAHTTTNALRQQKHSLKKLKYTSARFLVLGGVSFTNQVPRPREPGLDAGFADFGRLEEISLVGPSAAFERAVLSSTPPPNLRSLSYESDNPLTPPRGLGSRGEDDTAQENYLVSLLPFLRAPSASVPHTLEQLTVVYHRHQMDTMPFTEQKMNSIRDTALGLKKKHGATLMVSYLEFGLYYPPLLHGEPQPRQYTVYNGAEDEFGSEVGVNYASDDYLSLGD